jgi:hypothetical protein
VAHGATSAAQITAANLRVDSATAEVLRGFEGADVRSLQIKGASFTRWLSAPDDPRRYHDCDLLVPPADFAVAEQVLADLGFSMLVEEGEMPEWWREHATTWFRDQDGAKVDLHRTLTGVGVQPDRLWESLSSHTEELEVGGYPATVLTIPGRAFTLALHAAQHGADWDHPMTDLEQAASATDEASWRAAAEIAAAVNATPAFAAGLRLVPASRRIADRLGLPTEVPTDVALRASSPPPVALGIDQLAQAKGLRARALILWRKLVPPPTFMRHWSPRARKGRIGLILAYLWRPLWLLGRLPAGFRAWRRARHVSRRSGSASD